MSKKTLMVWQTAGLSDPRAVVEQAAKFAAGLVRLKARGPGDVPNAMRSVEREYGVGYSVMWGLRYRRDRVKDVAASVFFRLRDAYEAECSKQIRKLEHESYVARQIAGPSDPAADEADAVVENARKARRVPPRVRPGAGINASVDRRTN